MTARRRSGPELPVSGPLDGARNVLCVVGLSPPDERRAEGPLRRRLWPVTMFSIRNELPAV